MILPLNSNESVLNNGQTFSIRWDYWSHFIMFLPMPILFWLNFKSFASTRVFNIIIFVGFTLLIAFLFEAIQYFLPYRAFNVNDVLSNFVGVSLGLLVLNIVKNRIKFYAF